MTMTKRELSMILDGINLPEGIILYQLPENGQKVWELRTTSFDIRAFICYLITKIGENHYKYGIEILLEDTLKETYNKIDKAIAEFKKNLEKVSKETREIS